MPAKKRSGDSAVYNRPLGGGEAIDDDVEGHSMIKSAAHGGGPGLKAASSPRLRATEDDDVEGHSMKMKASGGGHGLRASGDEDTEGHSMRLQAASGLKPRARARVSDSGDEDTEGHSHLKSQARRSDDLGSSNARARGESSARARVADDGDDTEGHQRVR